MMDRVKRLQRRGYLQLLLGGVGLLVVVVAGIADVFYFWPYLDASREQSQAAVRKLVLSVQAERREGNVMIQETVLPIVSQLSLRTEDARDFLRILSEVLVLLAVVSVATINGAMGLFDEARRCRSPSIGEGGGISPANKQ